MSTILIAYASTHGAHRPRSPARHRRRSLRSRTATPVAIAPRPIAARRTDPSARVDYDAVIAGASIHAGAPPARARRVGASATRRHAERDPVGVLLRLPGGRRRQPTSRARHGARLPRRLRGAHRAGRRALRTTFAGALQYREYEFVTRLLIRVLMHRGGHPTDTRRDYDYTDWDAVETLRAAVRRCATVVHSRSCGSAVTTVRAAIGSDAPVRAALAVGAVRGASTTPFRHPESACAVARPPRRAGSRPRGDRPARLGRATARAGVRAVAARPPSRRSSSSPSAGRRRRPACAGARAVSAPPRPRRRRRAGAVSCAAVCSSSSPPTDRPSPPMRRASTSGRRAEEVQRRAQVAPRRSTRSGSASLRSRPRRDDRAAGRRSRWPSERARAWAATPGNDDHGGTVASTATYQPATRRPSLVCSVTRADGRPGRRRRLLDGLVATIAMRHRERRRRSRPARPRPRAPAAARAGDLSARRERHRRRTPHVRARPHRRPSRLAVSARARCLQAAARDRDAARSRLTMAPTALGRRQAHVPGTPSRTPRRWIAPIATEPGGGHRPPTDVPGSGRRERVVPSTATAITASAIRAPRRASRARRRSTRVSATRRPPRRRCWHPGSRRHTGGCHSAAQRTSGASPASLDARADGAIEVMSATSRTARSCDLRRSAI